MKWLTGLHFMDFILEHSIFFIMAAAGLVQWWKTTQEAKAEQKAEEERRNRPDYYEEMIEEVESRLPRPAVPPALPTEERGAMPGVDRSPVPNLRRREKRQSAPAPPLPNMSSELERQAAIAEQLRELKRAKTEERPAFSNRKPKKVQEGGGVGLRARLRNRRELQDAFVLKEILEKPVGLR